MTEQDFINPLNLSVLVGSQIITFNGNDWLKIDINDNCEEIETFKNTRKQSIIEVPKQNNNISNYISIGGYDIKSKSSHGNCYFLKVVLDNDSNYAYDIEKSELKLNSNRSQHCSVLILDRYILTVSGRNQEWIPDCEFLDLIENKKQWNNCNKLNSPRTDFDMILLNKQVFVYGGFSGKNKYSELIETLEFNENQEDLLSPWKILEIKFENGIEYSKAFSRIFSYEEKIYVVGGINENRKLNEVNVIDLKSREMRNVGKLLIPRSNYHFLNRENELFIVGGNGKFDYSNYAERFDILTKSSSFIPIDTDVLSSIEYNELTVQYLDVGLSFCSSFSFKDF